MMRKQVSLRKRTDGFTLVEMSGVLMMIGLMLLMLLPVLLDRRPVIYPLDQDITLLKQDFQTLRLMQYAKADIQNTIQFHWRGDGAGYFILVNDRILWQRTFQSGNSCIVPPTGRVIYFKSYHSTYASTWNCRSAKQEYEIKFLLGNYQMVIRQVR
ncbi:prepilin-type cleavage/methylation domain-containing protein [Exiguobacterium sp. s193]|uniref:prepilin-type cleavage/methylation domain-containing protein n=1 Tax=Exiguobacterium sp. s193 TaxID=2751207 RepID=UPI0020366749|nr:prepilin-type cleavage/methylation domain-containing protein [Exiguobacterium sp. s193]